MYIQKIIKKDGGQAKKLGGGSSSPLETPLGRLTVPLISTVHFVHSAYKLFVNCNLHCCRVHLSQALSRIDSPVAIIQRACVTLSNILLKSFVPDNSDKERQLGCLRRKEKLSSQN